MVRMCGVVEFFFLLMLMDFFFEQNVVKIVLIRTNKQLYDKGSFRKTFALCQL